MTTKPLLKWTAGVWLLCGLGCAPGYHAFSGCWINCRYCPPPPMPYTSYNCPVCHSSAATQALNAARSAEAEAAQRETSEERPSINASEEDGL